MSIRYAIAALLALGLQSSLSAQSNDLLNLQDLLSQLQQETAADNATNAAREDRFQGTLEQQQQRLEDTLNQITQAEQLSIELERLFEVNDLALGDLERRLDARLGSLKELFGVLQQVAADAQSQFQVSVSNLHNPERVEWTQQFAERMGQTSMLPEMREIEQLWLELQREMTYSSEVRRFNTAVVDTSGQQQNREVVRIGLFNLVADGDFLRHVPETNRVIQMARQPSPRYRAGIGNLQSDAQPPTGVYIDPVRGQLLDLLVQSPNLRERIAQAGVIGYVIICLGIFALLLALYRLGALIITEFRVANQRKQPAQVENNNPLGRVLRIFNENRNCDRETLELKLGEAVLRETPRVTQHLNLLKIIAAVAPLLGLLGTVTGMIVTFQAITLFGAGDPKLMAGGISQALMTTVLGLCVAIPTLLLHNLVSDKAKRMKNLLEQESFAIVASIAETEARPT